MRGEEREPPAAPPGLWGTSPGQQHRAQGDVPCSPLSQPQSAGVRKGPEPLRPGRCLSVSAAAQRGLCGLVTKSEQPRAETGLRAAGTDAPRVGFVFSFFLRNELETQYLFLLRFRLHVSASVYAKYYFDLRSLASDHKLPNEFACLRKERAQALEVRLRSHRVGFPPDTRHHLWVTQIM